MAKRHKIVMGTCKLCLTEGVRLQESHFLSKGIYKALRIGTPHGNSNPVMITPRGAVQTSNQVWAHLLCSRCEGRLCQSGEDWVMRNGLKNNGSFRLLSALKGHPFQLDHSRKTAIYRAAAMPKVDVFALTYFAASIFWRGSIHPWNTDGTRPVPLGVYEEPLRLYLLGEADFPEDVTLSVVVRVPSKISYLTSTPLGEWRGPLFVAKFPMPGLAFGISAGPAIPAPLRRLCFVRGDGHPFALTAELEQYIYEDGVKLLARIPPERRPGNNAFSSPSGS